MCMCVRFWVGAVQATCVNACSFGNVVQRVIAWAREWAVDWGKGLREGLSEWASGSRRHSIRRLCVTSAWPACTHSLRQATGSNCDALRAAPCLEKTSKHANEQASKRASERACKQVSKTRLKGRQKAAAERDWTGESKRQSSFVLLAFSYDTRDQAASCP